MQNAKAVVNVNVNVLVPGAGERSANPPGTFTFTGTFTGTFTDTFTG